jgi:hypothetical protein
MPTESESERSGERETETERDRRERDDPIVGLCRGGQRCNFRRNPGQFPARQSCVFCGSSSEAISGGWSMILMIEEDPLSLIR